MSNHPIVNRYSFKDSIYKYSFIQLIFLFLFIFFLFTLFYFSIYFFIFQDYDIDSYKIFKFSLFQSFGHSLNDVIKEKHLLYDFMMFTQKTFFVVINLVFTSSVIFKYFNKPDFFQFKKKINFKDDVLTISLYNRTNFNITSCNFRVYARLPFIDKEGFNSLNNVEIFPTKKFFPFMDQHLVTRLVIDLNNKENKFNQKNANLDRSLSEMLKNKKYSDSIQYLQLSVIIEAVSTQMDSHIYEIYTYKIDINDEQSIQKNVTFFAPKSINIDMVNFSKSTGWENFED